MCVFNPDIKDLYLKAFENEDTKEVYTRLFKKSFDIETELDKDLFDFEEKEWEKYFQDFLRPKTKESARSYCNVLVNYVQWAIESNYSKFLINPLKRRQEYFYEFVQEVKLYFSFSEKEALISNLENKQDSFIIEGLWHGIQGSKVSELVNLRVSDIDKVNNKIKLRNNKDEIVRVLDIEEDEVSVIEMAILANQQRDYYRSNGVVNHSNLSETIELSESEYVLKSAHTKRNGQKIGGEKVSHYTVYNRLEMIRTLGGLMKDYQDALTTKNIVRSGMIYNALKLYKRDGELDTLQIKEICEKYNIKYKWAMRDYLNVEMLNELYPSEMLDYNNAQKDRNGN